MMRSTSWRWLWLLTLVGVLGILGSGPAEGQGPPDKGKGKKSFVVQVDLKKLPRDLAQEVLKYVEGGEDIAKHLDKKGKKGDEAKAKKDDKGKKGLDYAKGKGKGKDKKGEEMTDLERRLERLAREIEELRKDLRRR
jgi:hypothetical protein